MDGKKREKNLEALVRFYQAIAKRPPLYIGQADSRFLRRLKTGNCCPAKNSGKGCNLTETVFNPHKTVV